MQLDREYFFRMMKGRSAGAVVVEGGEGGGGGVTLGPLLTSLNDVAMPTAEGYLHWNGSAWEFPSIDLSSYATQQWVLQQGYITSSAISDMATKTWVGQQGFATTSQLSHYLALTGGTMEDSIITPGSDSYGIYPETDRYGFIGKSTNWYWNIYGSRLYAEKMELYVYSSGSRSLYGGVDNNNFYLYPGTNSYKFNVDSNGYVTAQKFVKDGGTSSQFLKADGSSSALSASDIPDISATYATKTWVGQQNFSHGHSVHGGLTSGHLVVGDNDFSRWDMPFTFDPDDGGTVIPAFLPLSGGTITGSLGVNGSSEFGGQMAIKTYGDAKLVLNDMPNGNTEPEGYTYIEFRETNTLNETSVDGKLGLFGDGVLKWMESDNTLHTIATQDWVNSQGHVASAGALKYGGNTKAEAGLNGVTVTGQLVTTNSVVAQGGISTVHVDIDDDLNFVRIRSIYSSQTQERYVEFVGYGENDGTEAPTAYKFDSEVRATAFKKTGSSNDYVLLGGGGTKEVIDFATWMDRPVTARGLNVAGDSTMAAPHVRMTYDYVSAGRFSMNFTGYAGDTMVAPISYIFDAPVTQSSDIRMKDIIRDEAFDAESIAKMPLVTFYWKKDEEKREHFGTIAQNWEEVIPEVVIEGCDGMKSMDYGAAAMAAGVTACREVVALKKEIERLKGMINNK